MSVQISAHLCHSWLKSQIDVLERSSSPFSDNEIGLGESRNGSSAQLSATESRVSAAVAQSDIEPAAGSQPRGSMSLSVTIAETRLSVAD
jgi:hypothetical protein